MGTFARPGSRQVRDLKLNTIKHLILLGDSIFDNRSYVNGGRDVITHVREQMPESWEATLRAVDGHVAGHVPGQLKNIPPSATHLFVSVGGNDALQEMDILRMRAGSGADVFSRVSDVALAFENRYRAMLDAVLRLGRPTTVCTVYYPRYDEPFMQKIAVAALASFNDVIIRQASLAGLPVIDLRYVCDEYADYANPIEPSEAGGRKIARTILRVAEEHDFERKRTSIYF